MSDKKVIAVTGATGSQGSGLVRAILNDPAGGFSVRVLTRHIDSEKSREFAKRGAELVVADVDNPESMRRAFDGAYGAYCVTFFWDHFSVEREMANAKSMAEAAKSAGLQHVIWSTLEDTRKWVPLEDDRMPTLQGNYKVPHFDGKGASNHFFTDADLPVTFLLTSFYWDNFIHFGMGPKRGPDGTLAITFPMDDKKLPGIAAEDIGKCAYAIFRNGERYIRQRVGIAGEHLTGAQMAAIFSDVLGETVRYNNVPPEVYRSFGFPGADDLGNMFQFKRDFEQYFCGARSVEFTRRLNPDLQDFRTWLVRHRSEIPWD